jgi:hypothetical protein
MCVQTADAYAELPNDVNIKMSITKFKNGKENGHDQIPAQLIKEGEEEIRKAIYELILEIWEEEIIQIEWKYCIVCPIHQKWDVMM